ncbi:hypothetical protein Dimus_002823, partial [Dionaea muscipula]
GVARKARLTSRPSCSRGRLAAWPYMKLAIRLLHGCMLTSGASGRALSWPAYWSRLAVWKGLGLKLLLVVGSLSLAGSSSWWRATSPWRATLTTDCHPMAGSHTMAVSTFWVGNPSTSDHPWGGTQLPTCLWVFDSSRYHPRVFVLALLPMRMAFCG